MKKYKVCWSKAYYMSGEVIIDAIDEDDAFQIVDCNIGDYVGNMQYSPIDNTIDNIVEVDDESTR